MRETTRMGPTQQESGTYIDHYEWKNAIPYQQTHLQGREQRKQAWPKIKKK